MRILSKIGHHFNNKLIKKLMLSKKVNNKKCAPKLVFFNENKLRKIQMIKNSKFNNFLLVCWFLGKNLPKFVSPVWKLHNPYCHNWKCSTEKAALFLNNFLRNPHFNKSLHSNKCGKNTCLRKPGFTFLKKNQGYEMFACYI